MTARRKRHIYTIKFFDNCSTTVKYDKLLFLMFQSKQNTKDLSNREILDSRIYSDKFFPICWLSTRMRVVKLNNKHYIC